MSDETPGALLAPQGTRPVIPDLDPAAVSVAVVASRFNDRIVQRLLDSAVARLVERGVAAERIAVATVPGAFELGPACRAAAGSGAYAAVVALGCVIRGETPHFEHVCAEAARGVAEAAAATGVPVAFGVLTVDDEAQALARAGGDHGDKGADAADAALDTAAVLAGIRADAAGAS